MFVFIAVSRKLHCFFCFYSDDAVSREFNINSCLHFKVRNSHTHVRREWSKKLSQSRVLLISRWFQSSFHMKNFDEVRGSYQGQVSGSCWLICAVLSVDWWDHIRVEYLGHADPFEWFLIGERFLPRWCGLRYSISNIILPSVVKFHLYFLSVFMFFF